MADTFKEEIDKALRIPAFRQSKQAIDDWNTNAPKISDSKIDTLIGNIWEQIPNSQAVLKGENMKIAKEYVKKAFRGGLRFSTLGDVNQCEYSIGKPGVCQSGSTNCINKYCYLCGYRIFPKEDYKPLLTDSDKKKIRKEIDELEDEVAKKMNDKKKGYKGQVKDIKDKISSLDKLFKGQADTSGKLYQECEHVLPFLYGSFFVGLVEGAKQFKQLSSNKQDDIKAEYKWSHMVCNRLKTQGPFILYNDRENKWELDKSNIGLYYLTLETKKQSDKTLLQVLEDPPKIKVSINTIYQNYYNNFKQQDPNKDNFRIILDNSKSKMIETVLKPLIEVVDKLKFSPRQFYYALIIISHILTVRVKQADTTLNKLLDTPLEKKEYETIANNLINFGEQYQNFYNLAEQHFEEDLGGLIEYIIHDDTILKSMTTTQQQELREYLNEIKAQEIIDKWQLETMRSAATKQRAVQQFKKYSTKFGVKDCSTQQAIRNAIRCYGKRLKFTKRKEILPYIKYRLNIIKKKHGY